MNQIDIIKYEKSQEKIAELSEELSLQNAIIKDLMREKV
jgi:hypothetical protein